MAVTTTLDLTVMDPPASWTGIVINPSSVNGTGALQPLNINSAAIYRRMLVKAAGTSIQWFGVVLPFDQVGGVLGGVPHIFFTPQPSLGGYQDQGYDNFGSWQKLWNDYTTIMGSQIAASGKQQILIIPFFKNAQAKELGAFLANWKETIQSVVTTAINSVSPYFLRDSFVFDNIYISSFSSGIYAHRNFYEQGAGVKSATLRSFDLDAKSISPPVHWLPAIGIAYVTQPPGVSPAVNTVYLGNRFGQIMRYYPSWDCSGGQSFWCQHSLIRLALLHGVSAYS